MRGVQDGFSRFVILMKQQLGTQVKGKSVIVRSQAGGFLIMIKRITVVFSALVYIGNEVMNFTAIVYGQRSLRCIECAVQIVGIIGFFQSQDCNIVQSIVRSRILKGGLLES